MKIGDLVMNRTIDDRGTGIILSLERRSLTLYSDEEVEAKPIRRIVVLQADGEIKKWWAVHAEVIE